MAKDDHLYCAFHDDGYCKISNYLCNKKCRNYLKRNFDSRFVENISLLEHRNNVTRDFLFRLLTVLIAVGSLIISFFTLLSKVNPHILLDCNSGQCTIITNRINPTPTNIQITPIISTQIIPIINTQIIPIISNPIPTIATPSVP